MKPILAAGCLVLVNNSGGAGNHFLARVCYFSCSWSTTVCTVIQPKVVISHRAAPLNPQPQDI